MINTIKKIGLAGALVVACVCSLKAGCTSVFLCALADSWFSCAQLRCKRRTVCAQRSGVDLGELHVSGMTQECARRMVGCMR